MTRDLSALTGTASSLHGLQVAYGLLLQWVVERREGSELEDLLTFYRSLGSPCNLKQLGLQEPPTGALLTTAATLAVAAPHTRNFPRTLTTEDVVEVMLEVERLTNSR